MKVTETQINPRISYSSTGKYAKNGSPMGITTLKAVLDRCASDEFKGKEKGSSGCILPYVSEKFGDRPFVHEGVVILDLDRFNKESALRGKENRIFDKFDEIAGKYLPNLLAMNFSYSHNLHVFIYDQTVTDEQSYNRMSSIYTAIFAKVVKEVVGIDLREYEGALDEHQKAYQKLFINHSPYKWNPYCTQLSLTKSQLKGLQSEYKQLFSQLDESRIVKDSTPIDGKGDIKVDKSYFILGWSGFDARTVIAAAAYFHFKKDIKQAKVWLADTFSNAKEISSQMISLVRTGRIVSKYRKEVETVLFHGDEEKYILKENEYLSDKINFAELTEQYYYIQSNTNTGKTEFVKNLIKDREIAIEDYDSLFDFKDSYVVTPNNKVIILQITKALRDGKKHGIESKTYNNWDEILERDQIHTTLEGFLRNVGGLDLSNYTIVVDESHLLEEYITIRRDITRRVLEYLEKAGKVIFMSATPKSDIKMFPFKKLIFEKVQQQTLNVYQYPIYLEGRGSREAARYLHMVNFVRELADNGEKVLVFSNKNQQYWKDYGLNENVTLFNSANTSDPAMKEILENNRLVNNITLATKYMGCGVEVKNERKVHVVFFLDEGWNFDFIVQAIGRARDAEEVCLHLFYTGYKKWYSGLKKKDIDALNNAFEHLTAYTPDGLLTVNVLAAKMTGIYDTDHSKYSVSDKINTLILGNILTENSFQNPFAVELFRYLPYKEVNVKICNNIELDTDKKKRRVREEKGLIEYLCNCSESMWSSIMSMEYEELFKIVPYNDKVTARNTIRICKYIYRQRLDVKEVMSFFDKVARADKYIKALITYCNIEAGWDAVETFEGSELTEMEMKEDIARMKSIFTEEFIEGYITDIMRPGFRSSKVSLKMYYDEVFKDVLKSMGMWHDDEEEQVVEFIEATTDAPMFRSKTFKDSIDRKVVNSINGKKGGRKKQSISIQIVATGEVRMFGSKSDCMEFLKGVGCSARQFNKLLKGEGDFAKNYKIL